MIRTRFRVETGPHAGKPVFNQFVISPDNANALGFFFRHMRVLGLDDAFFGASPSIEQVAAALVNKRARIRVSVRQWNDQDRNQIDAILPPANGRPATPPSSTPPGPSGPLPPGGMSHFAPPASSPAAPSPPETPPAGNVTPIKPKVTPPPAPELPF
jgi:hypothetical protein